MKHTVIPAVFTILQREDGKILLLKRKNTGWRDDWWCLPTGHGEKGESFLHGAMREAKEEVGVDIEPKDMQFVHLHETPSEEDDGATERINVYFLCKKWQGSPVNAEPHKASEIGWFAVDDLPEKTIEHFASAINHSFGGVYYSSHGFES